MEVKQTEMTPKIWAEWGALIKNQECAVCGGQLTIHTIPARAAMALGCPDPKHSGYRQRTSLTEEYRRGAEVFPTIRDKIESKMMVKTELQRALNKLALRFPDAIRDVPGAALFIDDCMRLGLDPLIQPAEAVPIPFKTRDKAGREKTTVAMVVTEDGALSMAARGCPDEYDGSPATMPLLDYLMREHPQRPLEDLKEMAKRTAEELCSDPQAYVWVALGKRRSATTVNPVYGYYTTAEHKKAIANRLPAGTQPGNQARVRAIKRWCRETFPEARQKMIEYTAELYRRSEGVKAAQDIIDAEYTVFTTPLISPPEAKTAKNQRTGRAKNTAAKEAKAETAEQARKNAKQSTPPAPRAQAGEDLVSEAKREKPKNTAEARAAAAAEDKGFSRGPGKVDLGWLNETLKEIRWSEETAITWLAGRFKVDSRWTLTDVLARLTREQSEQFVHELQERAARQQVK